MPQHTLDRRSLRPRDYAVEPLLYGQARRITWQLPVGGDRRSLHVARAQHLLAWAINARGDRGATRRVTQRFGFSKQWWSDCKRGLAWMPATLLAAGITLLLDEDHS